ncbi:hypothetical protein D3C71_1511750 [compost metagenome]
MHHFCIIGCFQPFIGQHPSFRISEDFSILLKAGPVFNINVIRILQSFINIMTDVCSRGEILIQFVSLRLYNCKIKYSLCLRSTHPFRKRVRYRLWQCFYVRCPCKYNFRFCFTFPSFFDGYQVRQTLQWVARGTFQTYHRNSAIFDKFVKEIFVIILISAD